MYTMCRYLLSIIAITVLLHGKAYGQLIDSSSDDEPSLESPYTFTAVPQIILADESEEPDSGNWYEKLRWWKEAKALYTVDIRSAMDELEILNEEFESRKTEIFSALDTYSSSLPLKRQTAIHVIDDLLNDLVKRQEALAQERTRTQTRKSPDETSQLEEHQKLLNELKKEFEDFNALSQRIKQVFEVVIPAQMQSAQNFNAEALASYESIEQTLDDKKAHRLFNQVQNGLENIESISSYLKGPLWGFIDNAWQSSEQLMPKITKSITNLEDKGVVVRPLSVEEKAQMTRLEEERAIKKAQQEAALKAAKEWAARPWWQKAYLSVGSFFSYLGSTLWYGITRPFSWFSGSTATPEKKVSGTPAQKVESLPSAPASQPSLPSKLPIVVSSGLAPQKGMGQAPKKNNEVPKPSFAEPKDIMPLNARPELPQKNPLLSEPSKGARDAQEEAEEPTLDDEDGEFGEPEDGFDETEEEEVPDLETEEDESAESTEEEGEQKPSSAGTQEASKDQGNNSGVKN